MSAESIEATNRDVPVGFGLLLNPEVTRPMWAWSIAPFNTRFPGAIYLSAMMPLD
ncbi:MAG: hypothetical protein KAU21_13890 [Gammaproteobacteria bacterium]|nr:hypothetical protein [Gammaproteobacteria bacterium]